MANKKQQQRRRNQKKGNQVGKPGKPKNQAGKNAGKKGPSSKVPPVKRYTGVYEPSEILRGPALRKAVAQTVNSQIAPALRGIRGNIGTLQNERGFEENREDNRAGQALTNTKAYYDGLAKNELDILASQSGANTALQATLGQIGTDAQTALTQAGNSVTAGLGENTGGQSIGSRERLAQMMGEQISGSVRNNAITKSLAAGQGTAAQQLMAELGVTGQMRGGEINNEVQGEFRNAKQRIRNEYAKEIAKQRQAALEIQEKRPNLMFEALNKFRESERNQEATDAALGIERSELKLKGKEAKSSVNYAKVSGREQIRALKLKQKNRLEEIQEQGASYAQLNALKSQQNKEYLELQGQITKETNEAKAAAAQNYLKTAGKTYGGKEGKGKEGYREFSAVFSYLRKSNIPRKVLATDKKAQRAAYDKLRAFGASDAFARKAIKKYILQGTGFKKGRKGGKAGAEPDFG